MTFREPEAWPGASRYQSVFVFVITQMEYKVMDINYL